MAITTRTCLFEKCIFFIYKLGIDIQNHYLKICSRHVSQPVQSLERYSMSIKGFIVIHEFNHDDFVTMIRTT